MRARAKVNNVAVDRFKAALSARGLTASEVSVQMGFASNYLSQKVHKGYLDKNDVVYLDKVLGIPFEEYCIEEPVAEEPEPTPAVGMDENVLYKTIYAAVYAAVKAAWEDA